MNLFYMSEESGCNVYITNDSDKFFFEDRYVIDIWNIGDKDGKVSDKQGLVSYIREELFVDVNLIDSLYTLEEKVRDAYASEEVSCSINRFEIE